MIGEVDFDQIWRGQSGNFAIYPHKKLKEIKQNKDKRKENC